MSSYSFAAGHFRRRAQPRQHAVARRRLGREFVEGRFRLGRLVGFREFDRLVEGAAGLGRPLGLQILVAAPAADPGDDQERAGDDENRILVPQLLELFATYFLVDFIK
jgi:hypothetical protein